MAQVDVVAALRAYEASSEQNRRDRELLDQRIRDGVASGEWKIVDLVRLTGWSRETVRKIAYAKGEAKSKPTAPPAEGNG